MDVMDEMDTVDQLTVSPSSRRQKPVTNLPRSPARGCQVSAGERPKPVSEVWCYSLEVWCYCPELWCYSSKCGVIPAEMGRQEARNVVLFP